MARGPFPFPRVFLKRQSPAAPALLLLPSFFSDNLPLNSASEANAGTVASACAFPLQQSSEDQLSPETPDAPELFFTVPSEPQLPGAAGASLSNYSGPAADAADPPVFPIPHLPGIPFLSFGEEKPPPLVPPFWVAPCVVQASQSPPSASAEGFSLNPPLSGSPSLSSSFCSGHGAGCPTEPGFPDPSVFSSLETAESTYYDGLAWSPTHPVPPALLPQPPGEQRSDDLRATASSLLHRLRAVCPETPEIKFGHAVVWALQSGFGLPSEPPLQWELGGNGESILSVIWEMSAQLTPLLCPRAALAGQSSGSSIGSSGSGSSSG
eukprot:RCo011490